MEFCMSYLFVGICMLVVPTSLALGLDANIDKNSQDAESEIRLLSRILEAKKEKMASPETSEMELREEKETVEKIDDDRTKIDLTDGNELVEEHIRDCKNRYEIIIMKESERHQRPMTCYLRKMDDALYSSACLGTKNMPSKAFTVLDEIVDKDFLSQDGPDSVCRVRPMFNTATVDNVNRGDTSSRRGLDVSKKTCTSCGFVCNGWWNCPWVCRDC
ncbi:hypothetical protein ACJMK2_010983 [Sinanodonta woodiana]|uniref:Uncharacterized protein n=1 Tax=Sinanodonta woodiana TaxID=1069815 RepID=A0ABD3V3E9_SINWO